MTLKLYDIIAAFIINNMDPSVDPCDDFYQFACGNFIKNTIIDDDKSSVNIFDTIQGKVSNELRMLLTEPIQSDEPRPFRMAKLMFKSCMDIGIIIDKLIIVYIIQSPNIYYIFI